MSYDPYYGTIRLEMKNDFAEKEKAIKRKATEEIEAAQACAKVKIAVKVEFLTLNLILIVITFES